MLDRQNHDVNELLQLISFSTQLIPGNQKPLAQWLARL